MLAFWCRFIYRLCFQSSSEVCLSACRCGTSYHMHSRDTTRMCISSAGNCDTILQLRQKSSILHASDTYRNIQKLCNILQTALIGRTVRCMYRAQEWTHEGDTLSPPVETFHFQTLLIEYSFIAFGVCTESYANNLNLLRFWTAWALLFLLCVPMRETTALEEYCPTAGWRWPDGQHSRVYWCGLY